MTRIEGDTDRNDDCDEVSRDDMLSGDPLKLQSKSDDLMKSLREAAFDLVEKLLR